jgi:SWI/SNF chromatin-remodeling complex subunit SWI1
VTSDVTADEGLVLRLTLWCKFFLNYELLSEIFIHASPHQTLQSTLPSFASNTNTNLDSSQVAKQMAALSAANQARISQNTRNTLPTTGGTSSGPYLGAINSHTYPPGGHDLMSNANPHPNFQVPNNNYGLPPTPNSLPNASFSDPAMSQSRNQAPGSSSIKQRQQGFLQGLAGLMAKRNTPLPPSLTGISYPNYDANNTLWSIIEPSSEIGSFRLAGRDVDLFKLWGLVFQQGGGHTV